MSTDSPKEPADRAEYIVVARRYRPRTFAELIGQQHISQALCNAIETNRVGHAYLFTGARGVGKTSAARIFAKALNCANGSSATPCGECDICLSIASGEDVDVLEIDGASNRGIDEIRQLRSNVNVRPSRSRFKVYIIDEVHMLTKEAFNALLKTLEEPPDHVKFIFCTTDPEKIPITVLSRCQRFDFAPVETSAIVERLQHIVQAEGAQADDEALEMLARRAAGSMRDSQSLLEQLLSFAGEKISVDDVHGMLGTARSGRVIALVDSLTRRDVAAALGELDAAVNEGVDVGQLAEQLVGHLRDMTAVTVGCGGDILLHNDPADLDRLKAAGQSWGLPTMLAAMQILDQTVGRMRQSVHRRTLVEMALVRMGSLDDLSDLSELIAQVTAGTVQTSPRVASPADPGKKKTTAVANSDVAPPHTESADGNAVDVGTSATQDDAVASRMELTSDSVRQVWRSAVKSLDGVLADVASDFQEVALNGNDQMVVSFATAYNCSYCQRPERLTQLEEAVARVVGRKLRVDLRHESKPADLPQPASQARNMRQMVRESYENAFVRKAVEVFDGEVTRVQTPPQ